MWLTKKKKSIVLTQKIKIVLEWRFGLWYSGEGGGLLVGSTWVEIWVHNKASPTVFKMDWQCDRFCFWSGTEVALSRYCKEAWNCVKPVQVLTGELYKYWAKCKSSLQDWGVASVRQHKVSSRPQLFLLDYPLSWDGKPDTPQLLYWMNLCGELWISMSNYINGDSMESNSVLYKEINSVFNP